MKPRQRRSGAATPTHALLKKSTELGLAVAQVVAQRVARAKRRRRAHLGERRA